MNEEAAFLRAICEQPDEDTPRLAFADWLTEQGGAVNVAWANGIRAQVWLARGATDVVLVGRDAARTERVAADLRVRYHISASGIVFDAEDLASARQLWQACLIAAGGEISGVVVAHGLLLPQEQAQADPAAARKLIDVNFTSPALLLDEAASYFEKKERGPERCFIGVISSVAGDRGRQSNYIYGSAKAGLTAFAQGLRQRLAKCGVSVTIIKPGFVDTAMTWGLLKPNSPIVASPQKVARDAVRAIHKGKASIYTPWFWWGIMTIIRNIPDFIFRKMKL
jgi:uncharacterized protein (TIGR02996 family)